MVGAAAVLRGVEGVEGTEGAEGLETAARLLQRARRVREQGFGGMEDAPGEYEAPW